MRLRGNHQVAPLFSLRPVTRENLNTDNYAKVTRFDFYVYNRNRIMIQLKEKSTTEDFLTVIALSSIWKIRCPTAICAKTYFISSLMKHCPMHWEVRPPRKRYISMVRTPREAAVSHST